MAHDQARVVIRHRVVAVALAGVVEAPALPGPAGDVEMSESSDGYGTGSPVDVGKRAVRGQVRIQNPAVSHGEPVGPILVGVGCVELRPVVVAVRTQGWATLGFVVEQDS